MGLTNAERETIIRWDDEEKIAHIWTNSPVTMRKLGALIEKFPETYRAEPSQEDEMRLSVQKKFVRFGKPASEAQKAAGKQKIEAALKARRASKST